MTTTTSLDPAPLSPPGVMFPIVGMGGSAGGLQAFQEVLANLPPDTGMGFVLVSHLDPTQESLLASILGRSTDMPTAEVTDGVIVEPNHVYVLPPNAAVILRDGALRLVPREGLRHECIDYFLTTLAEERGNCAVAVILSGTAADGAEGCRSVKAAGGITFAQDEASAKFSQMPRNAVATGCIDLVATPRGIAEELVEVSKCSYVRRPAPEPDLEEEEPGDGEEGPLQALFRMLRGGTGIDFARYKQNTVRRRVARRMAVRRLERLEDYVRYLEDHPPELTALHDELLINVTAFFRDPELFTTLAERVFPALTDGRVPDEPLRVWVAGCSTGEEAYSIAIAFLEFVQARHLTITMQMFATDVSERAIARARAGVYGDGIRASVSERQLRRYFTRSSTGAFQVAPQVRDLCVFARHDVTRDPPFSRLDLVSCRNVLIYMDSSLQKRVLPMFHYALRPRGFLALGSSESADRFPGLFAPVAEGYHLFAKVAGGGRPELSQASAGRAPLAREAASGNSDATSSDDTTDVDVAREADHLLLTTYVPTGIVVDERGHIVHFRGDTSRYLKVPSGPATFRLTSMVREELFLPLESALREVRERGQPVRRERVAVRGAGGEWLAVNLEVIPLRGPEGRPSGHVVVVFEGARAPAAAEGASAPPPDDELARIRAELEASRRHQQTVIEKLEGMNEELRSANEEVLSSNEELQSANEELETAKEELQSGNEELNTINDELQSRNGELAQVAGDLENLVSGIDIAIAIVDSNLRLRRFTPATARLLHVIPSDIGRPITDFKLDLDLPSLEPMIRRVMTTLETTDTEVRDGDGRWYSMRMRPYRTPDDRIDGVVIVWLDIEAMKQGLLAVKQAKALTEGIVETVRDPLLVLDGELRVQRANQAFYEAFGEASATTEGRGLADLLGGRLDAPGLRALLRGVATDGLPFSDFEVEQTFERLGRRTTLLHARLLRQGGEREPMVLLALEDVTARRVRERFSRAVEGLSRELDYEATLANVARLVVDSLCDWCCIHVRETDGSVRRAATLHRDAARTPELDADLEQHPLPLDLDCCWPQVLRIGRPEVCPAVPDNHALRWLRALGVTSMLTVPLHVRGTVRGVIWMNADAGGRRFGAEDVALAEELARHAALALDNARLYAEAHQTIRERERFVSIASHEMRTPLHGLQLQVQLLKRIVPPIPADKLDRLDRQCVRLAELMDALLDVARIRTDHLDLRPQEVDLSAMARAVVTRLSEDAQARGVALRIEASLPVVGWWDGLRLDQVVTNLLTNALKYGRGQPVDVCVSGDEWQAFLRVQDRGVGLSADERAALFRPYERIGAREQPGLGLGLFIVNEIVAAHGGTVTVESQVGAGSTFSVALPRAASACGAATALPSGPAAPAGPRTTTVTVADGRPAASTIERPSAT